MIKNRVSIDERPPIVNEKTRFGDLEIDTIIGKNHKGAILTITDRVSLMEWMVKLPDRNAREVALNCQCIKSIQKTFTHYYR